MYSRPSRRTVLSALTATAALSSTSGVATALPPLDLIVASNHTARLGRRTFRCALGRSGVQTVKAEGDGATPAGSWPLRQVFYRADRIAAPVTTLPVRALSRNDAWCDAPGDAAYNRNVSLPHPASAENLWRDDHLYDLVLVIGYNDNPVVPGAGSAIFMHVARNNYTPTAGCIAFRLSHLRTILARLGETSRVIVRT